MILIITYGNTLRGDDGAGLLLGEQLELSWRARHVPVERIVTHQLTPELAAVIAGETVRTVIFVDTVAVEPGEEAPTVRVYPLTAHIPSPKLGHHLDPTVLLIYADKLYRKQPVAWQVTVPGVAFDHGETLSATTQQALATAPDLLADWQDQVAATALTSAR